MKTNKHVTSILSIAIACIMAIMVVFMSFMPRIHGDETGLTIYGERNIIPHLRAYTTSKDEVAYCMDANMDPPTKEGKTYDPNPEDADSSLSYLILHAYPTTTYINGVKYNDAEARLLTQVALWIYRGFIDENGALLESSGYYFDDMWGTVPPFISDYGDRLISDANALVQEAKTKGPKANIPEEMKAKIYHPHSNTHQRMLVGPKDPWGRVRLTKIIDIPDELLLYPDYDLEKIEFQIHKDGNPINKSFKLKRDNKTTEGFIAFDADNPENNYIDLAPGFYSIVESGAPEGIAALDQSKEFYVQAYTGEESNTAISLENKIKWIEIENLIYKVSNDQKDPKPLKGAQFEVTFISDSITKRWIVESDNLGIVKLDREHFVSGDELFSNANGTNVLPLGELIIKEIKAPEGYALDKNVYKYDLRKEVAKSDKFNTVTITNSPIRCDLKFYKRDGENLNPMGNIPFKLTNTATGESHIITTNKDGLFDSSLLTHSDNTNPNDKFLTDENLDKASPEDFSIGGTWFTGSLNSPIDDQVGALPAGTYLLEELRCKQNTQFEMISFSFDVAEDKTLDLGDLLNWKTGIKTKLSSEMISKDRFKLIDNISYTNLPTDKEYTIITTYVVLGDKKDPEPLKVNGEDFKQITNYSPKERDGQLTIESPISKEYLEGKTIVAFEEIYEGDRLVASHKNPCDKDQTVKFDKEEIIHRTGISDFKTTGYALAGLALAAVCYKTFTNSRDVW